MSDGEPRYGRGENALLRHALWSAWEYRCYWCGEPKDFVDIQVDHIVPRSLSEKQIAGLVADLKIEDDFDLDDPHNLAPICARCNGPAGKSGKDLLHLPVVRTRLDSARRRRPRVVKHWRRFLHSDELAGHLIAVASADTSTEMVRQLLADLGPSILQKLALVRGGELEYLTFSLLELPRNDRPGVEVGISLDAGSRRAVATLEALTGQDVATFLGQPLEAVYQEICDRVASEFESHDEFEPATVGPPVGTFERLTVSEVRLSRSGGCIEFTFSGDFEVTMSASLVRSADDGFGLVELQGDAYATGRFEFVGFWDPSEDPDDLGEMEPWLTAWEAETSVMPA